MTVVKRPEERGGEEKRQDGSNPFHERLLTARWAIARIRFYITAAARRARPVEWHALDDKTRLSLPLLSPMVK
jgi:hypothetical protein